MFEAKIVLDSISPGGDRLTTIQATYPRFVHSELMTHRKFSRNAASSRAIPVKKQIAQVLADPAMPVEWGLNEPGMQANTLAPPDVATQGVAEWLKARDDAVVQAQALSDLGLAKQIVNRILEPFVWMTVIISATDWDNFWWQRCSRYSPLAQPELRYVADMMLEAYEDSNPTLVVPGDWHTPYIQRDEHLTTLSERMRVSAARCARVSYLTQSGVRDHEEDLKLYDRLVSAKPLHGSPLEHVATPCLGHEKGPAPGMIKWWVHQGNFEGWDQMRHLVA
jgi:thymidylate synthase ThyX